MSVSPDTAAGSERPQRDSEEFATQVRGMFDRIAGVYDLMNSAMTAGLHHQWRERAVDRARGRARARTPSTSAAAPATSRSSCAAGSAPTGGSSAATSRSRCWSWPARRAARRACAVEFGWADALDLPYGDASFDAVTVGFGARNLADLDKGLAEMTRVLRPGGRLVILEITRPQREPLATFYSLWFDRIVPVLGTRRRRRRRLQLPARVGPDLPRAAERWRRRSTPPASRRSAGCCSPAGSSPSTAARCGRDDPLVGPASGHRGDGRRRAPGCPSGWREVEERLARGRGRLRRRARRGGRGHPRRRRQAPAPAAGADVRPAASPASGPCGPPPPSSWSTWRLSSTTTSSTAPRCAAAGPPSSPARAATAPVSVGDLLFSRAFAELAGRRRRAIEVAELSARLGRARLGRARPAPRRLRHLDHRGALPGALPR